jgi:glycosyltransferase involved in cell wall biosynthesis
LPARLPLPVCVVIPTLNEEDRIAACLASVRWAAEVIVADAGSTDATVVIATRAGAHVIDVRGTTIAGQRNSAIERATQPWVLALDADERVTPELVESIAVAVSAPVADAYQIHFRNRYLGAPMERGGWGRDRHVRFFRASLRWRVKQVHESLDYSGVAGTLAGRIDHDSYRSLQHQLAKVSNYSQWGAAALHAKHKRAGYAELLVRPLWRFIKCYLLQGAILEGRRGVILAVVHAWSAFEKYALLWDMQRRADEATHTPPPRAVDAPTVTAALTDDARNTGAA